MRKALLAAALAVLAGSAAAQGFPSRTITLICPWPAGGPTDLHLRKEAELGAKHLGQPVIEVHSGFEDGGGYPVHFIQ